MGIHLIGVGLAFVAFLLFGRAIIGRQKGRSFKPLPLFILLMVAVIYHFVAGDYSFFGRLTLLLTHFGIAMILASLYLHFNKGKAILLWVPGLLTLMMGGLMSFFNMCTGSEAPAIITPTEEYAELLLELGPDDRLEEVQDILTKFEASTEKAFPSVSLDQDEDLAQYFLVRVPKINADILQEFLTRDKENVDLVSLNNPVELIEPIAVDNPYSANGGSFLADDPFLEREWHAQVLNYNQAYGVLSTQKPKKKVKVAIVDTGVDGDHEDLEKVFGRSPGDTDGHGHGTHCAGLAGASTNNGIGVGSLNWDNSFIEITGFPALDKKGRGSDRTVAKAIINAAKSGADVISMSLGGFAPFGAPKAQKDAIAFALKKGAIVVVAAGNSNDDAKRFSPASIDGVIVVAAVDQNLNKAVFSNTNTSLKMPIAAPGVDILSSLPGDNYQSFSGTSMATPIVAGLVGIMRAYKPNLSAKEAYEILQQTGREVNDSDRIGRVIQPSAVIETVTGQGELAIYP